MSNNLVERLRTDSLDSRKASISIMDLCMEAACRIESLESALKESEAARSDIGKMLAAAQKELHEVKSELGKYRGQQVLSRYSKAVESNDPLTLGELRRMDGEPVWWWNNSAKPVCTICVWDRFMDEPMFANYDWQSEDTLKLSKYKWLKKCGYKPYRQKPEEAK